MVTGVGVTTPDQQRMDGTTITVGIPTFNRAGLLHEAIESVLAQTYRKFRLIVSDNASTDETEVCASLADARLEYLRASEEHRDDRELQSSYRAYAD